MDKHIFLAVTAQALDAVKAGTNDPYGKNFISFCCFVFGLILCCNLIGFEEVFSPH